MNKHKKKINFAPRTIIVFLVIITLLCNTVPVQAYSWREAVVDVSLAVVIGGATRRVISNRLVAEVVSNAATFMLKEMVFQDPDRGVSVKLRNVRVGKIYLAQKVKYVVLSLREDLRRGTERLANSTRRLRSSIRDAAPVVADKLRTLKYKVEDARPVVAKKLRTFKYKVKDAKPVVSKKLRTLKYKVEDAKPMVAKKLRNLKYKVEDAKPVVAKKLRTLKYKAKKAAPKLANRIRYFFDR